MNVVWTDLAISSLRETNQFIIEIWNEEVSEQFLSSIDSKIEVLKDSPNIGNNEEKTSFKRLLIHQHISLFYELKDSEIIILLIWDNRQNPKELESKLK